MEYKAKKKYGQNFLIDSTIIDKIIDSVSFDQGDKILEIGPGKGYLTKNLIKFNNQLLCFEIDKDMKYYLEPLQSENLTIVYEDFLSIDLNNYFSKNDVIHVIANIPYYITTPIIEHIIKSNLNIADMTLMVQKEVANRLCAKPRSKDYGYITVFLNYYFELNKLFDVSKNSFDPIPKVDSAIIKLKNRKKSCNNELLFLNLIKDAFKMKRKNLRNNLKEYDLNKIEEVLLRHGLNLTCRAEEISIDIFIEIVNNL